MEIWGSHSGYQSEFCCLGCNTVYFGKYQHFGRPCFPPHSGQTLHFHSLPCRPTHHTPSKRGCSPTTPNTVTTSISSSVRTTNACLQNWLPMFWHL